MKKKKWKIGVKIGGNGVWLRGGGREKSGGTHKFSLLPFQNTISPNWSEKWEKYLDKIAPTSFNVSRSLFFFWLFLSLVMLVFCIFFFLTLVLSRRCWFFFFSFFYFLFLITFLRKHLWMIFMLFFEMSTFIYTQLFFKVQCITFCFI